MVWVLDHGSSRLGVLVRIGDGSSMGRWGRFLGGVRQAEGGGVRGVRTFRRRWRRFQVARAGRAVRWLWGRWGGVDARVWRLVRWGRRVVLALRLLAVEEGTRGLVLQLAGERGDESKLERRCAGAGGEADHGEGEEQPGVHLGGAASGQGDFGEESEVRHWGGTCCSLSPWKRRASCTFAESHRRADWFAGP